MKNNRRIIFVKMFLKIKDIFMNPVIRYSIIYEHIKDVFCYTDTENNFKKGFRFLRDNNIRGDYAEFGVYNGDTFVFAYYIAQMEKHNNMKFYAFDSFEGLPKPKSTDTDFSWKERDFYCSLKDFKKNLKRKKINMEKVICVKGVYEKSLKDFHNKNKLSFVHIDCDYYSSTKDVLKYIKSYLQIGTILLFDDWYSFKASEKEGEQRAFGEFIKENKDISFIDFPTEGLKKMFICTKIARTI